MKLKLFFYLILVFSSQLLIAKPNYLLELYKTADFAKFEAGLKVLEDQSPQKGVKLNTTQLVHHQICSKFWQDFKLIEVLETDSVNPNFIDTKVFYSKLVYYDNKIIYYKLEEIDQFTNKTKDAWYKKEAQWIDSLQNTYKRTYGVILVRSEMFDYQYSYGKKCGTGDVNAKLRKRLNDAMENDDRSLLSDWIRSVNIEKQIYAYEGLLYMKKEGQGLGNELLQLMKEVHSKKGDLNYCDGNKKTRMPIGTITAKLEAGIKVDE